MCIGLQVVLRPGGQGLRQGVMADEGRALPREGGVADHVLGNAAFAGEGTTFVGHHALPEALAARAQDYLPGGQGLRQGVMADEGRALPREGGVAQHVVGVDMCVDDAPMSAS
jgi:hypothetical protein